MRVVTVVTVAMLLIPALIMAESMGAGKGAPSLYSAWQYYDHSRDELFYVEFMHNEQARIESWDIMHAGYQVDPANKQLIIHDLNHPERQPQVYNYQLIGKELTLTEASLDPQHLKQLRAFSGAPHELAGVWSLLSRREPEADDAYPELQTLLVLDTDGRAYLENQVFAENVPFSIDEEANEITMIYPDVEGSSYEESAAYRFVNGMLELYSGMEGAQMLMHKIESWNWPLPPYPEAPEVDEDAAASAEEPDAEPEEPKNPAIAGFS